MLIQAKTDSVEKRWIPLRNGSQYSDVIGEPLCKLATTIKNAPAAHDLCPIGELDIDGDVMCCYEIYVWDDNETPENAQAVIDRINAIDVETWADKLVEMGVLENG